MRLFNEHLVVAASKCLESRSRHDCPGAAEAHKCEKCDVIQVFHLEEITISSLQSGALNGEASSQASMVLELPVPAVLLHPSTMPTAP
jgi:hypothetical protein